MKSRNLLGGQGGAHQFNRSGDIPHDKLSRNTQHTIPGATKMPIFASIGRNTIDVIASINFNCQFDAGCSEICDVVSNGTLPPKRNPKPFAANGPPESEFRIRLRIPH